MISTRTSANGCLNDRWTFSPAGRYRRPAVISARRKSPMAAMRSATGASADAQPASTTSLRSRAVTRSNSSALPPGPPGAAGELQAAVGRGINRERQRTPATWPWGSVVAAHERPDGPGAPAAGGPAARLGMALLLAAAVTAVLVTVGRLHQPDYSASLFGQ